MLENQEFLLYNRIKNSDKVFREYKFSVELPINKVYDITDEEILKQFAIEKAHDDNFGLALHIFNAIYNNEYDTEFYINVNKERIGYYVKLL